MSAATRAWAALSGAPRRVERASGASVAADAALTTSGSGRIVLGPAATVGRGCRIWAGPGATVKIDGDLGEGCLITALAAVSVAVGARLGERCALLDAEPVADDPERPLREQGARTAPVRIGEGAILGPGSAVLPGVTVGAGATVLANSVVTHDVRPGASVAGAPAR